jgi:hypothetical protein
MRRLRQVDQLAPPPPPGARFMHSNFFFRLDAAKLASANPALL